MAEIPDSDSPRTLFEAHPRAFDENRYVYPVLSRRARGISIGVNLNLDKACNFRCVYCQVDRTCFKKGSGTVVRSTLRAVPATVPDPFLNHAVNRTEKPDKREVEIDRLRAELERTVDLVTSGRIYRAGRFQSTPPELRRLNDIALSGDGEPTTCPVIDEVVAACADIRRGRNLNDVKLVLISNATMFDREKVRRALAILDANNGEIWAKLDAGTEDYYNRVSRGGIPFHRILKNLAEAAQSRPIVIQSLFMRIHGKGPSEAELAAYRDRLNAITDAGGRIKQVQIHTLARPPAESWVTPLSNGELSAVADLLRDRIGPIAVPIMG